MKTISERIRSRTSIRTFTEDPLSEEMQKQILELARSTSNPFGIEIRWELMNAKEHGLSSPVLKNAEWYLIPLVPKMKWAEAALGYSLETVMLLLLDWDIGSVWLGGTMNRSRFEKELHLDEDHLMPCVTPVGFRSEKRSLKEMMMRKGVQADSRLPFEALFFTGKDVTPLKKEEAGLFAQALENVRLAPSAVNKQPWRLLLENEKTHFYLKRESGLKEVGVLDLQQVDLGIALCHFCETLREQGISTRVNIQKPQMETPNDWNYLFTAETQK